VVKISEDAREEDDTDREGLKNE
jgi:hypothetical protein